MGELKERLAALDNAATSGRWGQFSPTVGPWQKEAMEHFRNKRWNNIDTSHHMSTITKHGPKRLSEWTHADDAAFAEALVNAYRAGTLGTREDF